MTSRVYQILDYLALDLSSRHFRSPFFRFVQQAVHLNGHLAPVKHMIVAAALDI